MEKILVWGIAAVLPIMTTMMMDIVIVADVGVGVMGVSLIS